MLLDQVVLENKRLQLRVGYDVFKVRDLLHHVVDRGAAADIGAEVRTHAVMQNLRLADIDNNVAAVAHDIDARFFRQLFKLFIKFEISGQIRHKKSPFCCRAAASAAFFLPRSSRALRLPVCGIFAALRGRRPFVKNCRTAGLLPQGTFPRHAAARVVKHFRILIPVNIVCGNTGESAAGRRILLRGVLPLRLFCRYRRGASRGCGLFLCRRRAFRLRGRFRRCLLR